MAIKLTGSSNEGLGPELSGREVSLEAIAVLDTLQRSMERLGPMPPEFTNPDEQPYLEQAA